MRQQIRVHGQMQGPFRIETRPEFRPLARPETAPPVEVIRGVSSQKVHPAGTGGVQPAPGATTPGVIRGAASQKFHAPGSVGLQPTPAKEFHQPAGGGIRAVSPRTFRQTSGFRATVPREFRGRAASGFPSYPVGASADISSAGASSSGSQPGAARLSAGPDGFSASPRAMKGGLTSRHPGLKQKVG